MSHPFIKEIKKHYQNQELTPNQIHQLQNLCPQKTNWMKNWLFPFSLGLSFAVVLLLIFSIPQTQEQRMQSIAKKIAYNHNKNMPSEVLTDQYPVVTEALDRLGFIVKPPKIAAQNFLLIGARYCTLNGKIAVQLKLENSENAQQKTVYESEISQEELSFEGVFETTTDGVHIKIWREGSLVFAMAETIQ